MRPTRRSKVALIGASIFLAAHRPAQADIHALLIGIDDYRHEAKVEGAVHDAEDIASSLRRLGAATITVLLNKQARRQHLLRSWEALVETARSGDTLVFTFAGHGSQETYSSSGNKVNAFLLADFDRTSPDGRTERVTNDEISQWFRAAGKAKALRVLFVADTCHSGSMVRSVDKRVPTSERAAPPYGLPDIREPTPDDKAGGRLGVTNLPNVTFLAATYEDKRIQAVPIEGRPRGALSYAFARVLDRAAASGGKLRRLHLESHVRPVVRALSEGRQIPKLWPATGEPAELLLEGKENRAQPSLTEQVPLRIKVLNLDVTRTEKLIGALSGVIHVRGAEAPDLIWDARDRTVLNGHGDIAAYDASAGQLQAIVDKWRAVAALTRMSLQAPLAVSLAPNDGRQPSGKKISFMSEPPRHVYLTSFNLEPDGTVRLVYPLAKFADKPQWPDGYRLELEVVPPFGAEHLIAVFSSRPLDSLHQRLSRGQAAEVPTLLSDALRDIEHQIGIQALYTYDIRMER